MSAGTSVAAETEAVWRYVPEDGNHIDIRAVPSISGSRSRVEVLGSENLKNARRSAVRRPATRTCRQDCKTLSTSSSPIPNCSTPWQDLEPPSTTLSTAQGHEFVSAPNKRIAPRQHIPQHAPANAVLVPCTTFNSFPKPVAFKILTASCPASCHTSRRPHLAMQQVCRIGSVACLSGLTGRRNGWWPARSSRSRRRLRAQMGRCTGAAKSNCIENQKQRQLQAWADTQGSRCERTRYS